MVMDGLRQYTKYIQTPANQGLQLSLEGLVGLVNPASPGEISLTGELLNR